MQGDKLFPGHQNVLRGGLRTGAPDILRGDALFDPAQQLSQTARGERRAQRLRAGFAIVRQQIEQRAPQFLGVAMAEFDIREFLQVVVGEPGMIDQGLQDQRLALGNAAR